jgi:hypothetical protein
MKPMADAYQAMLLLPLRKAIVARMSEALQCEVFVSLLRMRLS